MRGCELELKNNNSPTRQGKTSSTCIDVFLSNFSCSIEILKADVSDHRAIVLNTAFGHENAQKQGKSSYRQWSFLENKILVENMNKFFLQQMLPKEFSAMSPEQQIDCLLFF